MKTFDEACAIVSVKLVHQGDGPDPVELEAALERVKDVVDRTEDLSREVMHSEFFTALCMALCVALSQDQMDLQATIFTAFMNGLRVGIEMEKQESGVEI